MKKRIKFQDLNGGEYLEVLNQELHKVNENINDPNFVAESARSVTLTVTFAPNKKGNRATLKAAVASKMGKRGLNDTEIYIGREGGEVVSSEHTPVEQEPLFQDQTPGQTQNTEAIDKTVN